MESLPFMLTFPSLVYFLNYRIVYGKFYSQKQVSSRKCMKLTYMVGLSIKSVSGKVINGIYDGHQYAVIKDKEDFETSDKSCYNLGMHLAVITSAAEHMFIQNLLE